MLVARTGSDPSYQGGEHDVDTPCDPIPHRTCIPITIVVSTAGHETIINGGAGVRPAAHEARADAGPDSDSRRA